GNWAEQLEQWHEQLQDQRIAGTESAVRLVQEQFQHPVLSQVIGARQRLRIYVPTPEGERTAAGETAAPSGGTTLAMGSDSSGVIYEGFGVDTVGNVVMNARGGKAKSKMNLQANGQILVQSDDDSLYLVSKAPAVLGSQNVANVAGAGGVTIYGGTSFGNIMNARPSGLTPTSPGATSDYAGFMSGIANFWSIADATIAAASIARSALELKADPEHKSSWVKATIANAGNIANAINVAGNVLGVAGKSPLGGVTVHGQGGVILGTPMTMSHYAGLGITIGSPFVGVIGFLSAELLGIKEAKLTSAVHAAVQSSKTATVVGWAGPTEVASRIGTLNLRAPQIEMGAFQQKLTQQPTNIINVRAKQHIGIATKEGHNGLAAGIWIDSHDDLDVKVEKKITIAGKTTLDMNVATDKVYLKMESEKKIVDLLANNARLLLRQDDGCKLTHNNKASLVLHQSKGVWLGMSGSNRIMMSNAGAWKIKGTKADIL
ncbi:MAG: hypothetical protein IT379_24540, partial [Deltaproteobacteria bacterium]|nr:hypothetical protein [Deltaproteobacteria bacterium]